MNEEPDPTTGLLRGVRHLHNREVSLGAGVSLRSARKFWRALGFPNAGDGERAFTSADVDALYAVAELVRKDVLDETSALGLTRAIGRSVDRMASWQLQLVEEHVRSLGEQDEADAVAQMMTELADNLEPLIIYAWRRHLAAHLQGYVLERAARTEADAVRSVGFADLVSFTRLVRRLSENQLATLVQRFEATASDVVASHGGRVVKTVGDEVLFVSGKVTSAAAIALDIAGEMAGDPRLPDVRIGLATGPVVARLGDVFGETVNRASRLTALASPGTVWVDDATAAALNSVSGFAIEELPRRSLRGIGQVTPWLLTRRMTRSI